MSRVIRNLNTIKDRLYSKIGQLQVEVDFFAEAYKNAGLKRIYYSPIFDKFF